MFKYVLNFLFTVFTFYLVIQEIIGYLRFPTHTSKYEVLLERRHHPVIFVCPTNGMDIDGLIKNGYTSGYKYFLGDNFNNHTDFGWSGKGMGSEANKTVDEVLKEVSTIKSMEDCPMTIAHYEKDLATKTKIVPMSLTKPVHPFGICCKTDIPETPREFESMVNVRVSSNNSGLFRGLRIFLTDQNSASEYELNQLRVNGPSIECSNNQLLLYRAKVYEDVDLENDPQSKCRNYEEGNSFHQCLEIEYQDQVMDALGCSPPYITQNSDLWCTKDQLSGKTCDSEEIEEFNSIILGLWKGYIKKGPCHIPCHTTSFRVVKSGENSIAIGKEFGVNILLDKSVTVTESHFSINLLTLLTRIGGAIGVGKEGLWIVILVAERVYKLFTNTKQSS